MADSMSIDQNKVVVVPDNEVQEGLVLAGKLPAAALHHDTAQAARAQVERLGEHHQQQQYKQQQRDQDVQRHGSRGPSDVTPPAPEGAALEARLHPQPGQPQPQPQPPSSRQTAAEPPAGAHPAAPAPHPEGPHPHPHLHRPPLGSAVQHVRETVRGIVERVEKAVGMHPPDSSPPSTSTSTAPPPATLPHTALHVTPPASPLPPHDPAAAARERQLQQQRAAAAEADSAAVLLHELPSLEAIRDSARGYVDTLRHSVREPDEAAAELAGRMVGKTSYGHPHPHPHPHGSMEPGSGVSSPRGIPGGGEAAQQQQQTRRFSWGSAASGLGGLLSPAAGSPRRGSDGGGGGGSPQQQQESPYSLRHAVMHTPQAASELAGRIIGKTNYMHPQPQPHHPQPQPHPPQQPHPQPQPVSGRTAAGGGAGGGARGRLSGGGDKAAPASHPTGEATERLSPGSSQDHPPTAPPEGLLRSSDPAQGARRHPGSSDAASSAAAASPSPLPAEVDPPGMRAAHDPHSGMPLAALPSLGALLLRRSGSGEGGREKQHQQ